MVPDTTDWWKSAPYDFIDQADIDNLAWECLRRNSRYQKDFAASFEPEAPTANPGDAIQNRWGLRFPGPAQPQRQRTDRFLDA